MKWTALSDLDYYDEPWDRPEPCATRGCEQMCDSPGLSAFCYACRISEMARRHETFKRGVNAQVRKESV